MWITNAKKPIIALAPMADYTDSPFCHICRKVAGKDFVIFREMVSSEAVVRGNVKTLNMCKFKRLERPIVIQIFGSEPSTVAQAAKIINDKFRPDGIDINMGCPVPKIAGKVKSGAALLKDVDRAVAIIKAVRQANPAITLSVKTRLGWSDKREILKFAPKLEAAGIDLLAVHGRTKTQGYGGQADWGMIGQVKKKLSIPVIANGDINNSQAVKKCLQETGADGLMIGRGALGNPWVLKVGPTEENLSSRIKIIKKHAKLHLKYYNLDSLATFRKHLAWYFKGDRTGGPVSGLKEVRRQLMLVDSLSDLSRILAQLG